MSDEPEIREHTSPEALASDVAERLLVALHDAQSTGRTPHVGLTGGTIAGHVHRAVAAVAASSQVDWSNVVFWWGDERFVAPDSSDRNALQAREDLLDALVPLGLDQAHVHEMPSTADAEDVEAAAEAYARELRAHGTDEFEVMMFGMGPDGHVASLFPGFPQLVVEDRIAVGVTGSPKPPPERISLTFPALNRSRATWFLVSGEEKAAAVAQALTSGPVEDLPARGAHGTHETVWFLDPASASHLP